MTAMQQAICGCFYSQPVVRNAFFQPTNRGALVVITRMQPDPPAPQPILRILPRVTLLYHSIGIERPLPGFVAVCHCQNVLNR